MRLIHSSGFLVIKRSHKIKTKALKKYAPVSLLSNVYIQTHIKMNKNNFKMIPFL